MVIRKIIPHKALIPHEVLMLLVMVGEGVFFDVVLDFGRSFSFCLLDGPVGDIVLDCGLSWGDSVLTGELRTVMGWVTPVLALSRPDVSTKFRPVGGVPALVTGLGGVL